MAHKSINYCFNLFKELALIFDLKSRETILRKNEGFLTNKNAKIE